MLILHGSGKKGNGVRPAGLAVRRDGPSSFFSEGAIKREKASEITGRGLQPP